jgi:hypothetical protein
MKTANNKNIEILQKTFANAHSFSTDQVCEVLHIQRSTAAWLLSNLSKAGQIVRIGRGIYTLNEKNTSYRTPGLGKEIGTAIDMLRNQGITFVLTGLDILLPFVQHQPNRILHLIHSAKGAGSWVQSTLKELNFASVINPDRQEIEKILEIVDDKTELFVIREFSSNLASNNSLASLERAFIDLYFETSRELFPFSLQEVAHIFVNVTAIIPLSRSKMLRYANERSIRDEIQNILDIIKEPRTLPTNERSIQFLQVMRAIRQ